MTAAAPPEIFKAYDVRGIYGDQIDGDVAEAVGRAFARVIGQLSDKPVSELTLGLGRDMRLTAPELAARYLKGMVDEGAHVLDAGMVGTEMLYYLVGSRDLDGGLMCTASHNPKQYTGAKMVEKGALALSGDRGLQDIRKLIDAGLGDAPGGGSSEEVDIAPEFTKAARDFVDIDAITALKVVCDGGNGMAGEMVPPALEGLPLDLETFYWTPDGNFPDHEPNPLLPENREFLMAKVVETGADLGIAWDGDADRCFFIDDTGRFVDGDFLTALLAKSVLQKQPGADILYDVRASRAVPDTVAAAGGTAHVNRVGHAFFKQRMRDEGGAFGGEVSGHYYFADFYNADSGTVPALLILELLSKEGRKLSELVDEFRSEYFISGEINSEVEDAAGRMAALEERYADADVSKLDGVSFDYEDWHFNVRPSNTEPLLRLNLESLVSEADMAAKRDEVLAIIRAVRVHPFPIDTPWAVGRVNCYLIDDDPLTLIDTGPNTGTAIQQLIQALSSVGRALTDIERIVVTHQHLDHCGLTMLLAQYANADVATLDLLAPWIENMTESLRLDDEFAADLMLRHGVPEETVIPLRSVAGNFRAFGAGGTPVTTRLTDGGTLDFASHSLRVWHRPGHSPTCTIFHDEQTGDVFGGDHLLGHISSNPLVTRGRPHALVDYVASMRATAAMDGVTQILPGHGEPVTEFAPLIETRLHHHERRAQKIAGMLSGEPRSAHEIARQMWGKTSISQAFLTLSEVLGHVDLLMQDGQVVRDDSGDVVRFAHA